MQFNSINDLYIRVLPALRSKVTELNNIGVRNISELMIWNSIMDKKWKSSKNLELCDIVDDILNIDNFELINSLKKNDDEIELPKLKDN